IFDAAESIDRGEGVAARLDRPGSDRPRCETGQTEVVAGDGVEAEHVVARRRRAEVLTAQSPSSEPYVSAMARTRRRRADEPSIRPRRCGRPSVGHVTYPSRIAAEPP